MDLSGPRLGRTLPAIVATLVAAVAPALADSVGRPPRDEGKVRGVTISTHGSGEDWGTDVIGPTIDRIRSVGAGWVAIHPYAGIGADGTIRFRPIDPEHPPESLVRPIREAHARGMKILVKPHLAYWGSPFAWRGEIEFRTEQDWNRFFDGYERWIVAVARACREADGFVVGTELDRTVAHERRWRTIVAKVREATPAALTYAANWTDYRRVPFWDALDVIGIQAYFPLVAAPASDGPTLLDGWQRRMAELRTFALAENRRIVFTELGYNRSFDTAVRPWEYDTDGPEAEPTQEAALRAALTAFEGEPAVVGVFLWKWFPEPHPVGRDFQLATPRLMRAIADAWK